MSDNLWLELHSVGLTGPDRHRFFGPAVKTGAALTAFFAGTCALTFIDTHTLTAISDTLGLAPGLMGIPGPYHACASATA